MEPLDQDTFIFYRLSSLVRQLTQRVIVISSIVQKVDKQLGMRGTNWLNTYVVCSSLLGIEFNKTLKARHAEWKLPYKKVEEAPPFTEKELVDYMTVDGREERATAEEITSVRNRYEVEWMDYLITSHKEVTSLLPKLKGAEKTIEEVAHYDLVLSKVEVIFKHLKDINENDVAISNYHSTCFKKNRSDFVAIFSKMLACVNKKK